MGKKHGVMRTLLGIISNVESTSSFQKRWESKLVKPGPGVVKINCDAAFSSGNAGALGFVIRDSSGEVVLWGSKMVTQAVDVDYTEAEEVRWIVQEAQGHNLRNRQSASG